MQNCYSNDGWCKAVDRIADWTVIMWWSSSLKAMRPHVSFYKNQSKMFMHRNEAALHPWSRVSTLWWRNRLQILILYISIYLTSLLVAIYPINWSVNMFGHSCEIVLILFPFRVSATAVELMWITQFNKQKTAGWKPCSCFFFLRTVQRKISSACSSLQSAVCFTRLFASNKSARSLAAIWAC